MEVRRLRSGDELEAIAAIRDLKDATERNGRLASRDHMQRLLARDEDCLYLAYAGGRPVGFLIAHRFPRIDRDAEMVYLYEISVHPKYRRRGFGSMMIEALIRDCRPHEIMKIWVGTEADNTAARALFESTGARCMGEHYTEYIYESF